MNTVMLVDDEEYVLADLHHNVGWKALEVGRVFLEHSAKEALEVYKVYEPDVIISDIEMIEVSGLDLLGQIRMINEEVPFVFLTCHPDFSYMRQAMQLGSCDYLLKPVNYQELEALLQKLLMKEKQKQRKLAGEEIPLGLVDSAKQFVEAHLMDIGRIADIAEQLGVSESTLMHQFKKETGWSVSEYIAKTRLANASRLLKSTEWSINMISDMSGFRDAAYFSKVFRKLTNMSPSEYRKIHRG
jgi:two-component system response regulator YesN